MFKFKVNLLVLIRTYYYLLSGVGTIYVDGESRKITQSRFFKIYSIIHNAGLLVCIAYLVARPAELLLYGVTNVSQLLFTASGILTIIFVLYTIFRRCYRERETIKIFNNLFKLKLHSPLALLPISSRLKRINRLFYIKFSFQILTIILAISVLCKSGIFNFKIICEICVLYNFPNILCTSIFNFLSALFYITIYFEAINLRLNNIINQSINQNTNLKHQSREIENLWIDHNRLYNTVQHLTHLYRVELLYAIVTYFNTFMMASHVLVFAYSGKYILNAAILSNIFTSLVACFIDTNLLQTQCQSTTDACNQSIKILGLITEHQNCRDPGFNATCEAFALQLSCRQLSIKIFGTIYLNWQQIFLIVAQIIFYAVVMLQIDYMSI